MAGKVKQHITLRVVNSGEVIGEADLTEARVRAIVKAYALAGLLVEAVA